MNGLAFDRLQLSQTVPQIQLSELDKMQLIGMHPKEYLDFKRLAQMFGSIDNPLNALYMYSKLHRALDPKERKQLAQLLKKGVLHNNHTDDRRTTLHHLYGILTTRRAAGYDNRTILKETVDILSRPAAITQKFSSLSEAAKQQLLQLKNQGVAKPISAADLNVESSATCVASSVMYYMADKEPAELARHLNELTSPLNAFFEKTRFEEISPDDPSQALNILREYQIPFFQSGPK
jgi:hypothetical protein